MNANDEYILEILQGVGMIDRTVADKAREVADKEEESVLEVLSDSGMVSRMDIIKVLANQFGMETISLADHKIELDVVDMVPAEVVNRYKTVPVFKTDSTLTVAISDPLDVETLDSLRYILKCEVEGVVAPQEEIDQAIKTYYTKADDFGMESMIEELTVGGGGITLGEVPGNLEQSEEVTEDDAPIIKLVSLIIIEAYRIKASDIHIEPMEKELRVRYRIDGVLHKVESPPMRLQAAIISRIKIMSEMSISEKRIPQDGRIKINVMDKDLDLRVSTVPSVHGESVVMRLLDKENLNMGLPQLGFFSDDQAIFERLLALADGIVLVTGPTGSGKTTTLYACLNEINTPDRKIITVEEPVEFQLAGINQVQVRTEIGLTFALALRSILRQAPNIVMVGEIRDVETAEIAINASLTGHLVFSTLHTNDAPSAVTRITDIGVKPFMVASSLRAAVAQRLVRRICPNCKEHYKAGDNELRLLGAYAEQVAEQDLTRGAGCETCMGSGYKGRQGIYEIFVTNEEVQKMIFEEVPVIELRKRARELGMKTLREDGLRKAIAGITTLEEVFRVTMGDD